MIFDSMVLQSSMQVKEVNEFLIRYINLTMYREIKNYDIPNGDQQNKLFFIIGKIV